MDRKFEALQSSEDLSILNGLAFEEYLRQLFIDLGYSVKKTSASGDYGADLILTKGGKTIAVQAKQYAGVVGFDAIKEVSFARSYYRADEAWVITTSNFTAQARKAASATDVTLIDGKALDLLIVRSRKTPEELAREAERERKIRLARLQREEEKARREKRATEIREACHLLSTKMDGSWDTPLERFMEGIDCFIKVGAGVKDCLVSPLLTEEDFARESRDFVDRRFSVLREDELAAMRALLSCMVFVPMCVERATSWEHNRSLGYWGVPYRPRLAPELEPRWSEILSDLGELKLLLRELSPLAKEAYRTYSGRMGDVMDEDYWLDLLAHEDFADDLQRRWDAYKDRLLSVLKKIVGLRGELDTILTVQRNGRERGISKIRSADGTVSVMLTRWVMKDGVWRCLLADGTPITDCWVFLSSENVWCRADSDGRISEVRYEGMYYYVNLPISWEGHVVAKSFPDDFVTVERKGICCGFLPRQCSALERNRVCQYRRVDRSRISFAIGGEETFVLNVYATDDVEIEAWAIYIDDFNKYQLEEFRVPGTDLKINANFEADSKDARSTYKWVKLRGQQPSG